MTEIFWCSLTLSDLGTSDMRWLSSSYMSVTWWHSSVHWPRTNPDIHGRISWLDTHIPLANRALQFNYLQLNLNQQLSRNAAATYLEQSWHIMIVSLDFASFSKLCTLHPMQLWMKRGSGVKENKAVNRKIKTVFSNCLKKLLGQYYVSLLKSNIFVSL